MSTSMWSNLTDRVLFSATKSCDQQRVVRLNVVNKMCRYRSLSTMLLKASTYGLALPASTVVTSRA